ncbi:MAG: magnesium transporter [Spirochaetia bacterium]|nr:magnesium transporter [Spirochaetia bacterium]
MKNTILVPDVQNLLAKKNYKQIGAFCTSVHPHDAADILVPLAHSDIISIFETLDELRKAEIFSHFDEDLQKALVQYLSTNDLAALISAMSHDDRVDFVKKMPRNLKTKMMRMMAQAEREDIIKLSAHPEGTAGAVMTSEYVTLPAKITVEQAIRRLRREAPNKETIYYSYVVDKDRKLLGFVSLRDLITAESREKIENIMHPDVAFARLNDDQEVAARKIQKYDLIALPVIDDREALVGIITHDDALDIITQEQTEDLEKLMAITGSHETRAYMKTSSWGHFKNRAIWVIALAGMELFSGMIIHSYEAVFSRLLILALYMPMLADTGGNVGSQSATVIIRAMALKEIEATFSDFFKVIFKEIRISLFLSMTLAVLTWGKVLFLTSQNDIPPGFSLMSISLCIALVMAIQVVTATLIGALLPLMAVKLKQDPALVASPALATIVDITGLLIYFSTAKILLGL